MLQTLFKNGSAYIKEVGQFWEGKRQEASDWVDENVPQVAQALDATADLANNLYERSVGGLLDQGVNVAAENVSEATNSPALGLTTGLLLGMVDGSPNLTSANGAVRLSLTGSRRGPQVFSNESLDRLTEYRVRDQLARKKQRGGSGEYFTDDIGDSYRLDQKGKRTDGTPTYSFQNQTLKNQRNQDVDPRRRADGTLTTHQPEGDDFYKNRTDANTDAHHIAELRRSARLYEGLDNSQQKALYKYLEKRGITTGNSTKNRAEISTAVHKEFHAWFDKKYPRNRQDLSDLTLVQRKAEIDKFVSEFQDAQEQLFKLRQRELAK